MGSLSRLGLGLAAFLLVMAQSPEDIRAQVAGGIDLPDMGDAAGAVITPEEERRIGERMLQQAQRRGWILGDPEINAYISSLGYRLASRSDTPEQRFTFFVIKDGSINAFAAPGGFIGINAGLILASENESELASVMAHEIAHVTQRHIARRFAAADNMSGPALAAMLAAILVGTQNAEAGMGAISAIQGAQIQAQIDYTRANEKEADRVGMAILERADLDPRSMPSFFEKLQNSARYRRDAPEFLRTHPVTISRIADTRGRAEQYPRRQFRQSTEFGLIRMKVAAMLAEDPAKFAKRLQAKLDKTGPGAERQALEYGLAISLALSGRTKEARERFRKLLDADPDRVGFRSMLALTEIEMGNADKGLKLYEDGLALYPNDEVLVTGYAKAALRQNRPAEARRVLLQYQRKREMNSKLLELLAQAHGETGHQAEAHRALAEHFYLNGSLRQAIQQLKLAERHAGDDYYLATRVNARLRDLEGQAKAEEARR